MRGSVIGKAALRACAVAGIFTAGAGVVALVPIPGVVRAAGMLALPLAMMGFERAAAFAAWIGPPPSARRVLLVDDGCSTGRTMASVREALIREGFESGIPGEQLADPAGLSVPRVYQIRGRRR